MFSIKAASTNFGFPIGRLFLNDACCTVASSTEAVDKAKVLPHFPPALQRYVAVKTFIDFLYSISYTALPCSATGRPLKNATVAQTEDLPPRPTSSPNPWSPFPDRISFEYAEHWFVELQAPEKQIARGLQLWKMVCHTASRAAKLPPWKTPSDMRSTTDGITEGSSMEWRVATFTYTGEKPTTNVPAWMDETYELNYRNILDVLEHQLADPAFKDHFDTVSYQEFDAKQKRVYSNFFSGSWAYNEAVSV